LAVQDFAYHRPLSIEAALGLMAPHGARPLAGGTDLVPQLREGRREATHVVDIKQIAALTQIEAQPDGGIVIGAAASATSIAHHPHVVRYFPAVASACRLIGSWQIQNRASLGGNVCNAAPSADGVPPLICLGAMARVASRQGQRAVPVDGLFAGPGKTTLGHGEILVSLHLPAPAPRSAAAYLRFTPRREMDIAIAGAGAWVQLDTDGKFAAARIALASVAPTPFRPAPAEQALIGQAPSKALVERVALIAAQACTPISDTRGSADYRRHLVAVLTRRALADSFTALGIAIEAA
jgi:CO/xanthine dehydrogenase FAD-binding subunit